MCFNILCSPHQINKDIPSSKVRIFSLILFFEISKTRRYGGRHDSNGLFQLISKTIVFKDGSKKSGDYIPKEFSPSFIVRIHFSLHRIISLSTLAAFQDNISIVPLFAFKTNFQYTYIHREKGPKKNLNLHYFRCSELVFACNLNLHYFRYFELVFACMVYRLIIKFVPIRFRVFFRSLEYATKD